MREVCVGRETGEKYSGSLEVTGYWSAFCFQFLSAFQDVAITTLFPINPLRTFLLIPSRAFQVPVLMSIGQRRCWRGCVWKASAFHALCRAPRIGAWEWRERREHMHGPTFPTTSLLSTSGAEISFCQFAGILQPEGLIPRSCRKAGDMFVIPPGLAIRVIWEIQSVLSDSNLLFFFFLAFKTPVLLSDKRIYL